MQDKLFVCYGGTESKLFQKSYEIWKAVDNHSIS